jgi:integrase
MEQKFERVKDKSGEPIAGFFVRTYDTADGRTNRRYYGIFTDWKGIRRRFPLGNEQKAALSALADKIRKNHAEHDFDEAKTRNVTLTQWAEKCKNAMTDRDSSALAHLKSAFGNKLLSRPLTEKDLLDYRAKRSSEDIKRRGKAAKNKRTSQTTINKEVALLRKLMRLVQSEGVVSRLPKFKMEAEPSRERVLSAKEYQALLDKSEPWLQRVCVAAYETALSRGDLLGLTWDEVDRKSWVIQLRGGRDKTKVRQEIPIRTEALTALFKELDGRAANQTDGAAPSTATRLQSCQD